MSSKILKAINNRLNCLVQEARNRYAQICMSKPNVMSYDETINFILEHQCSVSRNGDGEIFLMTGKSIDFQPYDARLAELMKKALSVQNDRYLPCIIKVFDRADYKGSKHEQYYVNHLRNYRYYWYKFTNPSLKYGNASITRFYNGCRDVEVARQRATMLKKIWDGKNILLVEGEKSRLGVGNDLFGNAKSVRRILGPTINAFSKYDEIKKTTEKNAKNDDLILIALGPTATALSYDLYLDGFWAIDIGHIDLEYEWMLRGAQQRINIPGKYTNESKGAPMVGDIDEKDKMIYQQQIIEVII